jgi:FkbM family methyltransferase
MDLHFNTNSAFTDWIVGSSALHEPFVVVDVGVQGGENPRWHRLGDHLVVHGFDAIKEVVDDLREQNREKPNRHYHWIAAGSRDEERKFYFNALDPCSSSFYPQGTDRFAIERREQQRVVQVRRLDTLLRERVIPRPDFLKTDVEGFEKEVFLGAQEVLRSVLGIETETNFGISPTYPKSHFGTLQEILLERHLLVFDLNFNRIPRASFQRALAHKGLPPVTDQQSVGKPATLNVLFCRDLIDETDQPGNYTTPCEPVSVDQIVKIMIIYELHGLNDIAIDTAERFKDHLAGRLDVEKAIALLADPHCRGTSGGRAIDAALRELETLRAAYNALEHRCRAFEQSTGWPVTAPMRALRKALSRFS